MRRNTTPFRAVIVPLDDRLDGTPAVGMLRLVRRAALLDQQGQFVPLSRGQNAIAIFICHDPNNIPRPDRAAVASTQLTWSKSLTQATIETTALPVGPLENYLENYQEGAGKAPGRG